MITAEIDEIIGDYIKAAKNAMKAGFDGIEIHAANGYLLDQFINPDTNHRTDAYGGSIENRSRFVLEVVDAISDAIGAERVGIRFSPYGTQHDMSVFADIEDTFQYLFTELSKRKTAYIHLNDQGTLYADHFGFIEKTRRWYEGTVVFAGFLTKERAEELIMKGLIDLAAFGRPLISNPDLVERLKNNHPLSPGIQQLFYGSSAEGYTDYKKHQELSENQKV